MSSIGTFLRHVGWRLIAACGLVLGCIAATQAQGLTVAAITVDGQSAQSVTGVQVRMPGATSDQAQTLNAGQAIASGTEITPPRGARIELTSSNGNKMTLHPGCRFVVGIVTAQGESHQPLGGQIDFEVRKALDFFNIQYDRITAAVKGTAYSVEIDPAKSLTLSVMEGVVEVERSVQIKIGDAAPSDSAESARTTPGSGIRIAEDLKAGQSKTYALDVEEFLAEFKNFGEAEAYFRKALTEAEASQDKQRMLRAVQNLMEVYWKIGKPTATLELEGRCIGLAQGRSDVAAEAYCLSHAGSGYLVLGEYRKATQYYEKSLAMRERLYAARDHRDTATGLNDLGAAYGLLGEFRKAIEYQEKSLAMKERLYAARDHPDTAASLNDLGVAYGWLGEYRKAIEYHEKSLAMKERLYAGRDHPHTAASYSNLGVAYGSLGEYRKAIPYYEKSLAMKERLYAGRDHPSVATSISILGNTYYSLGEYRKAIEYHEKSLAMRERLYAGRDHPGIANSYNNLGVAYHSLSQYRKAIEYYEKSLAMKERLFAGRDHPDIANSYNNLGAAYHSLSQYRTAIEYGEKSLAMWERLFAGRDHPNIVHALRNLANAHNMTGNTTEAGQYRERAAAMEQRTKGK